VVHAKASGLRTRILDWMRTALLFLNGSLCWKVKQLDDDTVTQQAEYATTMRSNCDERGRSNFCTKTTVSSTIPPQSTKCKNKKASNPFWLTVFNSMGNGKLLDRENVFNLAIYDGIYVRYKLRVVFNMWEQ
jgi:hypothetical protein